MIEAWAWVMMGLIALGYLDIFWLIRRGIKKPSVPPDIPEEGYGGCYTYPDYEDGEWR